MIYPVLVRELLPKIGFAWTTRVLGFLNLGLLAIAFAFMRPRLPPRSTGPMIDWKAFTEPVFVLFVAGIFFVLWNVYFTFYYVRSPAERTFSHVDAYLQPHNRLALTASNSVYHILHPRLLSSLSTALGRLPCMTRLQTTVLTYLQRTCSHYSSFLRR